MKRFAPLLLLLSMATLLAGCATPATVTRVVDRDPFDCVIDPICEAPCVVERQWQAAPDGTGDFLDLAQLSGDKAADEARCDTARKACLGCIERARAAGVLK